MDDYVAVTLTGEFVKAQFGGGQSYNRVALLYLIEETPDAGLYGVSERGGSWGWRDKIWLSPARKDAGHYEPTSLRFCGDEPPAGTHYGMTYREAVQAGYVPCGTALQRGYVSRRANPNEQVVHVAGGTRHGQLYVLLNNPQSNQYCIRQYLRKNRDGE